MGEPADIGTLSFFNPLNIAKDKSLVFRSQTMVANNAFSLHALSNNFHGSLQEHSDYVAIGDIRHDIGTYIRDIGYVGYTYRKEAVIDASRDMMHLIYQVNNDLPLKNNSRYNISTHIEGFESHSMVYANNVTLYQGNMLRLTFGYGAELMYATQGQHGKVHGYATALGEKDYNFQLQAYYLYTENYLYDYDVSSVSAYGYTTHFALGIDYGKLHCQLLINDAFGNIYWRNIPYSDVTMNSHNKSYDKHGYAEYDPQVYGIEGTVSYRQKLLAKWRLDTAYLIDQNNQIKAGVDTIDTHMLPYLAYTHQFENQVEATLGYEIFFHLVGINIAYKTFFLGFHLDNPIEPSVTKLNIGYKYYF